MRVFLSYRRADSQATAGRLAQHLAALPVVEQVFIDVDAIAPGDDYAQRIEQTLARASHVFVLIGPQWAGPAGAAGGPSRLFDDHDMVRTEVRQALHGAARGALKLVPVLLDQTSMPSADALPRDLQPLARLHAATLRTAHFGADADTLLDALLGGDAARSSRWAQAPLTAGGVAWRALGGGLAGALLLLVLAFVNQLATGADLVTTLQAWLPGGGRDDARALLWLMGLALPLVGALLPFRARWRRRGAAIPSTRRPG